MRPHDIDIVALSHLHSDHIGWVADFNGSPTFPNAKVYVGRADWEYFLSAAGQPAPPVHIA